MYIPLIMPEVKCSFPLDLTIKTKEMKFKKKKYVA